MTTIEVVFRATWITDPTTGVSVQVWKTDRVESDELAVQVRCYAGGRRKIITTPAQQRSTPMTLRGVSAADRVTLRDWRGRLLLLRDAQGWRRWGTYGGLSTTTIYPAPHVPVYEVALTWQHSDHDESV